MLEFALCTKAVMYISGNENDVLCSSVWLLWGSKGFEGYSKICVKMSFLYRPMLKQMISAFIMSQKHISAAFQLHFKAEEEQKEVPYQ